jgi:antitoxin HicB
MSNTNKKLEYYLSLKYPITIHQDPEGGFFAEIVDLPGCMTQAETIDELMSFINEAKEAWITTAYEMGQEIPVPLDSAEFKGKILLRLSREIHRELAKSAEAQGISLNQYASNLLAAGVHGDLLKQQVLDLVDKFDPRVIKARYYKSTVFGNNDLLIQHNELIKLEGMRAPEAN